MKKDTRTVLITFSAIILSLYVGSMSYFERVYTDETAEALAAQKVASFLALERERKEMLRAAELIRQQEVARQLAIGQSVLNQQTQSSTTQQVAYVPQTQVYVPSVVVEPKPAVATPAPEPVVIKPSRKTRAS